MTRKLLYISFLVVVWNVPAFCQTDFDRLSREFTEKAVTSLGNESMITSDSLSLYVSKQTIGDAIVLTVNKAQLGVTIDIQKAKPIKDIAALPIRVPPLIKSCPHEEGACGSCEMHCSRFNVLCKGREAACAVGRDVCLAKNFAIEKGCQILKAAQDKLSKVDLAEFQFKDSTVFAKGTFNSTPLTINIQNNLKT